MKIHRITYRFGRDFAAEMKCEHCGHVGHIVNGYSDDFYFERVIQAMRCKDCGKNANGELEHTDKSVSPVSA